MQVAANLQSDPIANPHEDSFVAMPRNCDTAVVYWNLTADRQPAHSGSRLCIFLNSEESDVEELIILHRESGHFIVPLMAEDRKYEITLGWSDVNGFRPIFSQHIKLPEFPSKSLGAMSSSLSYRGSQFWPKSYKSSVN